MSTRYFNFTMRRLHLIIFRQRILRQLAEKIPLPAWSFEPETLNLTTIMLEFIKESIIRATPERVFAFHELPDALERLTPPWEKVKVIQYANIKEVGSRAILETRLFGIIPARWVAEHTLYDPPHLFEDIQISGPFRAWRHRHIIEAHPEGAILRDHIQYEPPMSFAGRLLAPYLVEPKLRKMFDYRHEITRIWCINSSVAAVNSMAYDTN